MVNERSMFVQAIYMKMMVKEAGMSFEPVISEMDLSYHSRYKVQHCSIMYITDCIVLHTRVVLCTSWYHCV